MCSTSENFPKPEPSETVKVHETLMKVDEKDKDMGIPRDINVREHVPVP